MDLKDLPPELLANAFVSGVEAAWPRMDAIRVVEYLRGRRVAMLAAEIWLRGRRGRPRIPMPIVYTWEAPDRTAMEAHDAYVDRVAKELTLYIQAFEWVPRDRLRFRAETPLFNLEW